jgi:hypothetical protein
MIRVQKRAQDGAILFIQDDGRSVAYSQDIQYNGREYYFLGGFYYNLEPDLADYIFGG